jgi:hypothetical protein
LSYDISLTVDTGGEEPAVIGDLDWNYTSNCGPMWRAAGADLAEFDGKPAGDCFPILVDAIAEMRDNPGKYKEMAPPNGWGSYTSLLPALRELAEAFERHPRAIVRVSR